MFEIGSSLREARLRQSVDFADAEAATKIRSKYLRALEEERFELLPSQTYVKGFLRAYAEYLGLDGQLYVDEYNSRYVGADDELVPLARARRRTPTQSRAHRRLESNVLLLALIGIASASALVVAAWKWGGTEPSAIPNLGSGTTAAAEPGGRAPSSNAPAETLGSGATTLVLTAARGTSWIAVYRGPGNGTLVESRTLARGEERAYAGDRLVVHIASPENLRARINGDGSRIPGSNGGSPVVVSVTPRGFRLVQAPA